MKKIYNYLLTRSKKNFLSTSVERYSGIDEMLLFNWLECLKGKYQYVRIGAKESDEMNEDDIKAFEQVYDGYIDEMGLNPTYKELLKIKIKIAKAQTDYVLTQDKKLLNAIRIHEVKAEQLRNQMNGGITVDSVLVHLSKWFGGGMLRAKKITVKEYFTLIKEFETANK